MTRPIKFRAWNTAAQTWQTEWSALDMNGNPLVLMPSGEYARSLEAALVFQQFTGLHDKNGKEIYEGDVLVDWIKGKRDEMTWRVDYREGAYWFVNPNDEENNRWTYEWMTKEMKEPWQMEVIGNVYESPELLTK